MGSELFTVRCIKMYVWGIHVKYTVSEVYSGWNDNIAIVLDKENVAIVKRVLS